MNEDMVNLHDRLCSPDVIAALFLWGISMFQPSVVGGQTSLSNSARIRILSK
jgi:hypothetical protein